jgi:endonuclease VIII
VPEGDALRRAAARLQPLVGEQLEVETPHPRAAVKGIAERLNGRRLESVDAVGKNLLLRFEGGLVLRSHLRMTGRWRLERRGARRVGKPWLVLRGAEREGVLWNGPVLELGGDAVRRLGPDVLDEPLQLDAIVRNLRATDSGREIGNALLDQRLVAGIGNMWKAEALWEVRLSPWAHVGDLSDDELRAAVGAAATLMHAGLTSGRSARNVYRRHVCPRCGGRVASRGQGDDNRTTYWCPTCQGGMRPASA